MAAVISHFEAKYPGPSEIREAIITDQGAIFPGEIAFEHWQLSASFCDGLAKHLGIEPNNPILDLLDVGMRQKVYEIRISTALKVSSTDRVKVNKLLTKIRPALRQLARFLKAIEAKPREILELVEQRYRRGLEIARLSSDTGGKIIPFREAINVVCLLEKALSHDRSGRPLEVHPRQLIYRLGLMWRAVSKTSPAEHVRQSRKLKHNLYLDGRFIEFALEFFEAAEIEIPGEALFKTVLSWFPRRLHGTKTRRPHTEQRLDRDWKLWRAQTERAKLVNHPD